MIEEKKISRALKHYYKMKQNPEWIAKRRAYQRAKYKASKKTQG